MSYGICRKGGMSTVHLSYHPGTHGFLLVFWGSAHLGSDPRRGPGKDGKGVDGGFNGKRHGCLGCGEFFLDLKYIQCILYTMYIIYRHMQPKHRHVGYAAKA